MAQWHDSALHDMMWLWYDGTLVVQWYNVRMALIIA